MVGAEQVAQLPPSCQTGGRSGVPGCDLRIVRRQHVGEDRDEGDEQQDRRRD